MYRWQTQHQRNRERTRAVLNGPTPTAASFERETLEDLDQIGMVARWMDDYERRNSYKVASDLDIQKLITAAKHSPVHKNMLRNFLITQPNRQQDGLAVVRTMFWDRMGWRYTQDLQNIWVINRKNPYHKGK